MSPSAGALNPALSTAPHLAPNILLIDDDVELTQMLGEYFASFGCPLRVAHNSHDGEALMATDGFDVALLDLMLPDGNGLDLLRRHRMRSNLPVIMLTAHGDEFDRVMGLESGADDYIAKPFSPRELKARIQAVLRRLTVALPAAPPSPCSPTERLERSGVVLYPMSGKATVAGMDIELTGTEARVLEVLMRSAGQVVPREQIGLFALGRSPGRFDRSIDTHISTLRRKLQRAGDLDGDLDTDASGDLQGTPDEQVASATTGGTASRIAIRNLRGRGYALMDES